MSRKRRRKFDSLCALPGPGDGSDPRFDGSIHGVSVPNRKAMQLCRQIERELGGILAESSDEVLRDLMVMEVQPAPHAMRLMVSVTPAVSAEERSLEVIYEHLSDAGGHLRGEIAKAIHRRQTPELVFRVV